MESKLLIPQMQSIVKNEIGQYKAEDLVQNRTVVQESIEEKLRESLGQSGIIVVSFAIENLDFEDGFEEAIRAKVVAEQEALKMQNKTKEKEELARQTVIEAQAEGKARRSGPMRRLTPSRPSKSSFSRARSISNSSGCRSGTASIPRSWGIR